MRRELTFKSLAGVTWTVREFIGQFGEDLTSSNSEKQKKAIHNMLLDCIVRLGDKPNSELNKNDIDRIPDEDQRYALIQIRQLSNDYKPNLRFSYQFPVSNNRRQKCFYEIDFRFASVEFSDEERLVLKSDQTYVKKEVEEDNDEEVKETEDILKSHYFTAKRFKQQVESYDLFEFERDIVLPRSKVVLRLSIPTVKDQIRYSSIVDKTGQTNCQDLIWSRTPREVGRNDQDGEVLVKPNLSRYLHEDLEYIRENILDVEGKVDTILVIENKYNPSQTKVIDLIHVPAFYFPSLGL